MNQVTPRKRQKQFIAYVRGRLLERQQRLRAQVEAEIRLQGRHDSGESADVADIASDGLEEEMAFRIAELRSSEVLQIDDALRRIAEGDYGLCEDCGQRIPAARLQAMPAATLCVRCQHVYECSAARAADEWPWEFGPQR